MDVIEYYIHGFETYHNRTVLHASFSLMNCQTHYTSTTHSNKPTVLNAVIQIKSTLASHQPSLMNIKWFFPQICSSKFSVSHPYSYPYLSALYGRLKWQIELPNRKEQIRSVSISKVNPNGGKFLFVLGHRMSIVEETNLCPNTCGCCGVVLTIKPPQRES